MARDTQKWTRNELLLAFEFYCQTPFGKLDQRNPAVVSLARAIGRTPGALAMKLVNFASLDKANTARGVRGLANASRSDRAIVAEFLDDWDSLVLETAGIRRSLGIADTELVTSDQPEIAPARTETERLAIVRARTVQSFFRATVLASYDNSCAICTIAHPQLLNASHIIPWAAREARRADPTNGLCLCAIHDRAFDRGLLSVNEQLEVTVSELLTQRVLGEMHEPVFERFAGVKLRIPGRFAPDREALRYHYTTVFQRRSALR